MAISIEEFYRTAIVDSAFDEKYYLEHNPEARDFYLSYCQSNGIDDKHRLFFHSFLKQKGEAISNYSTEANILIPPVKTTPEYQLTLSEFYKHHKVDKIFDEEFYENQCPDVINFYEPHATEIGITKKEKYYYHYIMHGKAMGFLKSDNPVDKSVSVIIAVKNRTENLFKILNSWHDVDLIDEIIVVDYSSDEPVIITDYNKVKVIRVENEKYFNLGKAYNLAFDFSKSDIVIKVDADYQLLDSNWLELYLRNGLCHKYFIRSDYTFSRYTSGFFVVHKEDYKYFREDLNGYGYDEIDLYTRIKKSNPDITEVIWFDIDNSIYHIPHTHESRTTNYITQNTGSSEINNRFMCDRYSPIKPRRNPYLIKDDNTITYHKLKIDRMFCINLDDRVDRWELLSKHNLERFSAIDTRKNTLRHKEYGLEINPCNISSDVYFKKSNGAVGVYLSHYLLWQKIVNENIKNALILEDDVAEQTVEDILNSNLIIRDNDDIINLSKRIRWENSRLLFDGAESYIISYNGAKKLLQATANNYLLNNIKPQNYVPIRHKEFIDWNFKNSITCPVDKFMGYCCEKEADSSIRLKYYIYPIVNMNDGVSEKSDINTGNTFVWDMNESELMNIYNQENK